MSTRKMHVISLALTASLSGAATIIPNIAFAVAVSGQGTWETSLQGRDLDGNLSTAEAYYDTSLNITWLADPRYAWTSGSANAGGSMVWDTANSWAATLNPYSSGITGWRLPNLIDTGSSGCNGAYTGTDCGYNVDTATSELAHMFYTTLGNKAAIDTSGNWQSGGYVTNSGSFASPSTSIPLNGTFWTATEYAPDANRAWYFASDGSQHHSKKIDGGIAWAVHAGDVGTDCTSVSCINPFVVSATEPTASVPEPEAWGLMLSGLALVGWAARRRSSAK